MKLREKLLACALACTLALPWTGAQMLEAAATESAPSAPTAAQAASDAPSAQVEAPTSEAPAPTEAAQAENPAPVPTVREAALAPLANDTSRVELRIGALAPDGSFTEGKSDYWTFENVSDVVDLDVSGKDYVIPGAYVVLRIDKTNKIEKLVFADSQAGTTERYSDESYSYVKYSFGSLSGGTHSTYPVLFDFDGHFATDGDTVTLDATLYAGGGAVVAHTARTYTAKTAGFGPYSYAWDYSQARPKYVDAVDGAPIPAGNPGGLVANGHWAQVYGPVDSADSTTLDVPVGMSFRWSLHANPESGATGNQGLEFPRNVKAVLTLPKGVSLTNPAPSTTIEPQADGTTKVTTFYAGPRFADTPYFLNGNYQSEYITGGLSNGRPNSYMYFRFDTTTPVNTDISVTADFYYNANDDGTGGTFIGTRNETVNFAPVVYKGASNLSIENSGHVAESHPGASWGSYDYGYLDGRLFHNKSDWTEEGMGFRIRISQTNNGSGYASPWEGGATARIVQVEHALANDELYYKSFVLTRFETSRDWTAENRPIIEGNIAVATKVVNEGNTRLYGVRADGTEKLLAEHVQMGQRVAVEEATEREFVKLVARFEEPVVLDNMRLIANAYVGLVQSETNRLSEMGNFNTTPYRSSATLTLESGQTSTYLSSGYYAFVSVSPLMPIVSEYIQSNQTVVYKTGGTPFNFLVGPDLPTGSTDWRSDYGDFTHIKNLKTITLLPDGIEYDGYKRVDQQADLDVPAVTTVPNYQGTGRTAVVVDYGDVPVARRHLVELHLRATKYTQRGDNDVATYMTWDDNDFIRPYKFNATGDQKGMYNYADALDLDGDGDHDEVFMQVHSTVTYVPPLELMLSKAISYDGEDYGLATTGDLGYPLTYRLNVFNNSIVPVTALSVIDVLPAVGDHTVVANAQGAYPPRGSSFPTGLTASIESANDGAVNDLFTFYYQVAPQGADLESVRDGAWLTAAQVTDFSQVKSFKAVLNDGKEIASKADVDIYVPSAIPFDRTLHDDASENPDKAVNSSAFSTDGKNYSEANSVEAYFSTYKVDGIYFLDLDGDGAYTEGTDRPLAGRALKIVGLDGSELKNPDGTAIELVTDAEGHYEAPVYLRGTYRIAAERTAQERFLPKADGTAAPGSDLDEATYEGLTAKTTEFALNPQQREATRNIAVEYVPGKVSLTKTAEAEEGEQTRPLAGIEFSIAKKDGSPALDIHEREVPNAATDNEGNVVFLDLVLGDYVVTEVSALARFKLAEPVEVTVNAETPEASLALKNALKRIGIAVSKNWDDDGNRDGARPDSVTVRLLADGTPTDRTLVLSEGNGWKGSFEGLRTHGDDDAEVAYTVTEEGVPEGYASVVSGTAKDGFTVTNSYKSAEVSVAVAKVWDDGNDADGIRPASATVALLADGKPTGEVLVLTETNDWKGSFAHLKRFEAGTEIAYTVEERDVPEGYEAAVSGDAVSGFIVTNTHKPAPVHVPPTDPGDTPTTGEAPATDGIPATGDAPTVAFALVAAGAALLALRALRQRA